MSCHVAVYSRIQYCVVLWCAVLNCMMWNTVLCCVLFCCVLFCCVVLRCVALRCVALHCVISCSYVKSSPITCGPTLPAVVVQDVSTQTGAFEAALHVVARLTAHPRNFAFINIWNTIWSVPCLEQDCADTSTGFAAQSHSKDSLHSHLQVSQLNRTQKTAFSFTTHLYSSSCFPSVHSQGNTSNKSPSWCRCRGAGSARCGPCTRLCLVVKRRTLLELW